MKKLATSGDIFAATNEIEICVHYMKNSILMDAFHNADGILQSDICIFYYIVLAFFNSLEP